jgi:hypothetical protein
MAKSDTQTSPRPNSDYGMPHQEGLASSPGFSLGLGLGMFVGAVACGLLTSRAGGDFMSYLEEKTSELKDRAREMLQGSELKEKVGEVLRSKAVEALTSAKDKAMDKVGEVVGVVTENVSSAAVATGLVSSQDESEHQEEDEGSHDLTGVVGSGKGKSQKDKPNGKSGNQK